MTFVNSKGEEFDTLDKMVADYRRSMTPWQRIKHEVDVRFCRWVRNPIRSARCSTKWAYQRVVRGWDDTAIWSLDGWLTKTLGEQLVVMADIAHGYPSEDYPFEQWTADLRKHGEALKAYAECDLIDLDAWESANAAAGDALRWVADNLGSLWD